MTLPEESQLSFHPKSFGKHVLFATGIALALLAVFLFIPEEIEFGVWVVLPMVTVSVSGALGGIFFSLMTRVQYQGNWKKVLAIIFSLLVYLVVLWLSLIAAFNVTGHWD